MSIFFDYDNRFAGLQNKVARFLGAAIVASAVIVIAIVIKQDIFASTTTLYLHCSDATDLFEGMAVKMQGFNVGKVRQITMEPDAGIKVRLEVKNEYMAFIRTGSAFRLAGKNLFEDTVINIGIVPGANPPIKPGSTLLLVREPGMSELATKLVQQVEPVLVEVRQAVAAINDPQGDTQRLLRNANGAVNQFAEAGVQFHRLALQSQSLLAEDQEKAGKMLDNGNLAVSRINVDLPATLQKIESLLTNIEAASSDLKQVAAVSADAATPLIRDGKAVVGETRDIVQATKSSWPLRNLLGQPEERILMPDSYVPNK